MNILIIIYAALALHIITAFCILIAPEPIQIARLGIFNLFFPGFLGAVLLFLSAGLAIIGLRNFQSSKFTLFLFFPQLFFLALSTFSALVYIFQGHYADGVIRPWYFIMLDQLPPILLFILYGITIFNLDRERER